MGEHKHNGNTKDHARVPLDNFRTIVCDELLIKPGTQQVTFVSVHRAWGLNVEGFGKFLACKAYFEISGLGDYEVLPTWVHADGQTTAKATTEIDKVTVQADVSTAFIASALLTPPAPGAWTLVLSWRTAEERAWQRGRARCPITVQVVGSPVKVAAEPEPTNEPGTKA